MPAASAARRPSTRCAPAAGTPSPRTPSSSHPEVLAGLPEALRARQPVFDRTGGVHAAALATPDGELLVVREDVGRHNAVDKVVGAAARGRELPFAGTVLVVSARASFEIVQKASVAGIPVVVAVGAASSLAVELATRAGITLVAFARPPAPVRLQPPRPAARRRREPPVPVSSLGRNWASGADGVKDGRERASPVRDRHRRKDDRVASREDVGPILNGIPTHLPDIDPAETAGVARQPRRGHRRPRPDASPLPHAAHAGARARRAGRACPSLTTTDYVNTISPGAGAVVPRRRGGRAALPRATCAGTPR